METLVLHPGALGDVILSLPALARLREDDPHGILTVAGTTDFLEVAVRHLADRRLSLSVLPLHRLYADDFSVEQDARPWRSFDRILSWTGSGDAGFVGNLTAVHRDAVVARWRPASGLDTTHVSRLFLDSLRPWIPDVGPGSPERIPVDDGDRQEAGRWLSSRGWRPEEVLTALHPGAGSEAKRWPVKRFAAAAQAPRVMPGKILVVEGPAEPGLGQELVNAVSDSRILHAANLPLRLLAGILAHCGLFIGNDSGIAHLAAALGLPCIVLFGPTSPEQWAPRGDRVMVLRDTRGCAGCRSRTGSGHSCMDNIAVEDVLRRLQEREPGFENGSRPSPAS